MNERINHVLTHLLIFICVCCMHVSYCCYCTFFDGGGSHIHHYLSVRQSFCLPTYLSYIHTYIHTYIQTDRQTDRHTYIHTDIHSRIYIHIRMLTCTYTHYIKHPYIHRDIEIELHGHIEPLR